MESYKKFLKSRLDKEQKKIKRDSIEEFHYSFRKNKRISLMFFQKKYGHKPLKYPKDFFHYYENWYTEYYKLYYLNRTAFFDYMKLE